MISALSVGVELSDGETAHKTGGCVVEIRIAAEVCRTRLNKPGPVTGAFRWRHRRAACLSPFDQNLIGITAKADQFNSSIGVRKGSVFQRVCGELIEDQ